MLHTQSKAFLSIFLCTLFIPCLSHAKVWNAYAIMDYGVNNMCAITFDDGPTSYTERLLDSLKEEGVKATFMLLGTQAEYYPNTVRRMVKEGHEVANHSYAHHNLRTLSLEAVYEDLAKTNKILNELGAYPRFFRPPYGKFNKDITDIASQLNMSVLLWSVDSRDWQRVPDYGNMPNILERPMTAEEVRGVYLFHDTKKHTVDNAKLIIAILRAVGCKQFVTASEYIEACTWNKPKHPKHLVAEKEKQEEEIHENEELSLPTYSFAPLRLVKLPLAMETPHNKKSSLVLPQSKLSKEPLDFFQNSLRKN